MEKQEHAEHVTPIRVYFITFILLVILMAITVWSRNWDFGSPVWNNAINLTIAVIKATLVVMFFMGVKYSTHLTKMFALAGFIWLSLMGIIFGDYFTRQWEPVQGWYAQDHERDVGTESQYRNEYLKEKGTRTEVQNSGATPLDVRQERP